MADDGHLISSCPDGASTFGTTSLSDGKNFKERSFGDILAATQGSSDFGLGHADILYLSISFRYETSARKPQERIGLLAGVQFPAHVADLPTLNASKCRTPIVGVIL